MIHCIANVDYSGYQQSFIPAFVHGTFEEFQEFMNGRDKIQFDVETNPTDSIILNRFRTLQFGEYAPGQLDKEVWVIEWPLLTNQQKIWILKKLQDKSIKKYIQNVVFEAGVCLNYKCIIDNIVDTMLYEKIIYTGFGAVLDEEGATFFSLEGIARRRLQIELDKTYQILFGFENPLTPGHIIYAAQDVLYLDDIVVQQEEELERQYNNIPIEDRTIFNYLPMLECEAALAFADISWHGMKIDRAKWIQNVNEAQPIIDSYRDKLNRFLIDERMFNLKAIELGYINTEDSVEINWNSPAQKKQLLQYAFPDLEGVSKPMLKNYLKQLEKDGYLDTAAYTVVYEMYENNNYGPFFNMMLEHCRDFLLENNFLIPAGTIRLNWNSPDKVIPLLKLVRKSLNSTDKETLNKLPHPIAFAILDYRAAIQLTSNFGMKFLEKIDEDDRARTRFNQILETGRVSSSDPPMQQIPVLDDDDPVVMNKYRSCFVPHEPDEVFVDSDYSSQELVIIAELSKDPVWMEALRNGWDLHSLCAQLVHGSDWDRAALESCKFKESKQKCKCPGHVRLRTGIKTINFGLAYGMSQFKLAATLKISVKQAEELIERYFRTFPKIHGKLTALGRFAIRNGFIMTLAPYFRKRWYPMWDQVKHLVDYHIEGIQHNSLLGSIERTGKNTPIQGGSADMTKLALVLVRREINQNNLRDTVKLVMQVHDQVTTLSKQHYAEQWKVRLTELMEQAAKVIIPSGLLKAESSISERWQK